MKMYIGGQWVSRPEETPVRNPFNQSIVDTVPRGTAADVEQAIASAARGAAVMGKMPGYERYMILRRTADLMAERAEDLAQTITNEEGKVIAEGRGEVQRAIQTITVSSEEAKRLHGETVPLDGAPGITSQFGFTIRVPVGIVAAISPFNFPLNLVCHKVGPALAAGNAVVLKPAGDTPLSAVKLTEILLEAGLPEEAIQCITGSGAEIGDAITGDSRNDDIIIAIAAAYPELRIWLDAGFSTRDTMAQFMRTTNIDFVFASESIPSMSGFERMRAPLAPERVVLSLDRSGAALIGCPDIFEQPNTWPERIIHMNLSRVGTESGPDWDGLKELHETAGGHKIYAAGGVRDEDDLRRLAEFGISGALVATALHNGSIRSLRLDGWSN